MYRCKGKCGEPDRPLMAAKCQSVDVDTEGVGPHLQFADPLQVSFKI